MKYSTQHKYQCSKAYDNLRYRKGLTNDSPTNFTHKTGFVDGYKAAIDGFNDWISSDDPPARSNEYLITPYDYAWTGFYNVNFGWESKHGQPIYPTHWMPLPEPPIEPTTGTKIPEE